MKAAKSALEKYATIRAGAPDLFENRDASLPSIQQILNVA